MLIRLTGTNILFVVMSVMFYSRKSARIRNYDYSRNNYYFITICTQDRKMLFGEPNRLNSFGKIADSNILKMESHYQGVKVDKYVVMPNHIHMIVALEMGDYNPDIRYVIAMLKSGITREIHDIKPDLKVWQRSFHDHIIRSERSYQKIWEYIENNPLKWEEDCFYCK